MATNYQKDLTSDRAINFARLFSKRKQLEPPVDVMDAIGKVATVEFDNIPTKCAALVIRNSGHPKVIVASQLRDRQWQGRLRFTLAHELAHIVLPWQTGTFFCHPDESIEFSDYLTQQMEGEANRFASELLVPRDWLRARAEGHKGHPADFVQGVMRAADVSAPAALFACTGVLAPGCTLAIVGADGVVQYIESTAGSFWKAPRAGSEFPYGEVRAASGLISYAQLNDRAIVSVQFAKLAPEPKPIASSSDILKSIIAELGLVDRNRQQMLGSVSGVIGALNGGSPDLSLPEDFLSAMKQRFMNRPELATVIQHPKFGDFLLAKAHELAMRRTKDGAPG